jgi:hypothetical protein
MHPKATPATGRVRKKVFRVALGPQGPRAVVAARMYAKVVVIISKGSITVRLR